MAALDAKSNQEEKSMISNANEESTPDETNPVVALDLDTNGVSGKTEKQEGHIAKAGARKAGYAPIKAEFLVQHHKPVLSLEYVSSEVKEKLESAGQAKENTNEPSAEKRPASGEAEGAPAEKKTKLKGRNKKRPRGEKTEEKDRMCPAVKGNRECRFGDKCKFQHDVKVFMEQKRPDLEGPCPIFTKFGICEYSFACRYAKNHLTENLENMRNEDLIEKTKDNKPVNTLDHDLRTKLWKRKYDFQRANKSVKEVERNFRGRDGIKNSGSNGSTKSNVTSANDVQKSEAEVSNGLPILETADNSSESTPAVSQPDLLVTQVAENGDCKSDVKIQSETSDAAAEKIAVPTQESNNETSNCFVDLSSQRGTIRTMGEITDEEIFPPRPGEKKKIDFKDKLYLAPLTTVGNLPFRRICKGYGADVTCGEMALAAELLKGKMSEFSLIRRHPSEDIFGAQICGCYPDMMTRCAQLLTDNFDLDFIDINCGCPIDMIYKQGSGSALMGKQTKLEQICRSMIGVMGDKPLTVKVRTGVFDGKNVAHTLIPRLRDAGVSLVTVHGRSREQRYTRRANWDYIGKCAAAGAPMPVFGNGDILSFEDANLHKEQSGVSGLMLARGALIKPWVFTEIKEQRHWDISSGERFEMLRSFSNYGLEHWGSDHQGVENTRRFLLEWLSFLHRYIPVGVLEVLPQKINERPPYYVGRNDLETLMASTNCADWVKITEMLLGPVPDSFKFLPKHKANAYH